MRWLGSVFAVTAALALTGVHSALSHLTLQQTTLLAPLDSLFTLTLVLAVLTLAWAFGSRLLRCTTVAWHNAAERAVFGAGLGLGVLAYTVMGLAFCHLLYPPLLAALAALAAVLLRAEVQEIAGVVGATARRLPRAACWRYAPAPWIAGGGVLVLATLLLIALLPPFGYDALWYHLTAPRAFLQQHSFVNLPAIGQAGFPFTVEMLYTIGLAFGSDAASALLHLSFAVLTIVGVWSFGARCFERRTAWLAVAALLTASDIQRLGILADIDLGLMLFEFLAAYALLIWLEERNPSWLVLAGAMAGLAMGSKYTALALLAPMGLLLLCANGSGWRSLRGSVRPLAVFVVCALLVASPWYLKNLIVYHDPLYPFLRPSFLDPALTLPPTPTPAFRATAPGLIALALLPFHVLQSAGGLALTGRSLADYLQLPLQVYLRGDLEMNGQPSLLFLLAPLLLLFDRRRIVVRLAFLAVFLSAVWALGPQELRYLVPVFPLYALLSAAALAALAARVRSERAARLLVMLPILGLLTVTLGEDIALVRFMRPLPVLAGL
ncbi:MAG TPA: glycosyltransferase family 39 protein, partial [Chloroflexota bacterium]|nr:glycosyltransferase family 39 protein [Chloroflexota bacterium]